MPGTLAFPLASGVAVITGGAIDGAVIGATTPAAVHATTLDATGLFKLTGVEDTLTAHAGGTKASALGLSAVKNFHRISVCATAADSVLLPAATAGQMHFLRNDGAASAQVFGAGSDTINGVATGTGIAQAAGVGRWYNCLTAGAWVTT